MICRIPPALCRPLQLLIARRPFSDNLWTNFISLEVSGINEDRYYTYLASRTYKTCPTEFVCPIDNCQSAQRDLNMRNILVHLALVFFSLSSFALGGGGGGSGTCDKNGWPVKVTAYTLPRLFIVQFVFNKALPISTAFRTQVSG